MTTDKKEAARTLKTQIRESSGRIALLKFDLGRLAKALFIASRTITDLTRMVAIEPDVAEAISKIPSGQRIIDTCGKLDAERAILTNLKAKLARL